MRAKWGFCAALTAVGLVACGGESSSETAFTEPDGGDDAAVGTGGSGAGGSGSGGATATAGAGGAAASGAGGGAASGGGTATGGGSGSGGAASADGGPCPVAASGDTTVCLDLVPEAMTAENDPELDLSGQLVVQIFDIPNPPDQNAGQIALAERVFPANASTGGEVALGQLRTMRFSSPSLVQTVYIRAIFIDNPNLPGKELGHGVWIGGLDLSKGLVDKMPLLPVPLVLGQGNPVSIDLLALRKLTVTAHLATTPLGDGQGKFTVVAVDKSNPADKPIGIYGTASAPCVDVAAGDVTVSGVVIGDGPYWVVGILDDLLTGNDFPKGSIASLTPVAGGLQVPTQLVIGAGDYSPSVSIDLTYVNPVPADAGAPGPNSCADLPSKDGGAADGG